MISFSGLDYFIILAFFLVVLLIGFLSSRNTTSDTEGYLLSGRKMGLILFIFTNVSTWYGGILGVGEFTYRYGILSWFTQGLPYYLFAILFAFLFAKKIRNASLFTIPDKIEKTYGKPAAAISGILIFVLVSPAPYLLMLGYLISLIFKINIFLSLLATVLLSVLYLFKGGYKADLYTDVFQFIVMFAGFILIFIAAYFSLGDFNYLQTNLPETHLTFTGGASPLFIIVWFLIASWTFIDPGFHQRCYAAKNGNVAFKGILISIIFWALFDFLTTSIGLYARASEPNLENAVLSYPILAERILGSGAKGIFYAALFATILSTLNSFMFLSATTFSRDFLYRFWGREEKIKLYTGFGLVITSIISILFVLLIPSVIEIWYTIGSICIPGLLLLLISAYYEKFKIAKSVAIIELLASSSVSLIWFFIRSEFDQENPLSQIEPMLIGIVIGIIIHIIGILKLRKEKPTSIELAEN